MSSVSGASTPILPRVRSISAIPFVVPIDLYAFQAAVLNRYARRVTYPVHLVVHVKRAPSHCVGIASARSGLRYSVHGVDLMHRCGGDAFTIQVKESSHLLHGSAPSTGTRRMRLGARQTSVPQVGACVGPSHRIRCSGTSDTSPGGHLSIPSSHASMNSRVYCRDVRWPNPDESDSSVNRRGFT